MKFEANVMFNGTRLDFRLADGTLLHKSEWNGECYAFKLPDGRERVANRFVPKLATTSRS